MGQNLGIASCSTTLRETLWLYRAHCPAYLHADGLQTALYRGRLDTETLLRYSVAKENREPVADEQCSHSQVISYCLAPAY